MAVSSDKVVIRRRGGTGESVRVSRDERGTEIVRASELGSRGVSVADRIRAAAIRIGKISAERRTVLRGVDLRDEQHGVFADVAVYFAAAAEHLERTPDLPFTYGRFIQPPRTGKTVVLAQIIAAAEVPALVLVPSVDLVWQTARELREKLPGTSVGTYCGEKKDVVFSGVNVATYQIVQRQLEDGTLPPAIHRAVLVFCDEAHRAMTDARMQALMRAFDPGALRIACTATPDWNERRTLASFFPCLIHEITLQEAFELDLFARLLVQVLGIRADASAVRIVGGDFDEHMLGEAMSADSFLDAAAAVRYDPRENAAMPALICCVSRAQARLVHARLTERRPEGSAAPALILGDTDSNERTRLLAQFEAGEIDTLVSVRVLVEGWDSPRCKLLIDLAPTLSEVLARQKYFRVMTKFGDAVARIFVLLPNKLGRPPIFPQELFGKSVQMDGYDDWLAAHVPKKREPKESKGEPKAKRSPEIQQTSSFDSAAPRLDPNNRGAVAKIVRGMLPDKDRLPAYAEFRRMAVRDVLFDGTGAHLMRYCGVRAHPWSYLRFMERLLPELAADAILARGGETAYREPPTTQDDVRCLNQAFREDRLTEYGWIARFGRNADLEDGLDEIVSRAQTMRLVEKSRGEHGVLDARHRFVIDRRFFGGENGDEDGDGVALRIVGKELGLSSERVLQIQRESLASVREAAKDKEYVFSERSVLDEIDPQRKRYVRAIPYGVYRGHPIWILYRTTGRVWILHDGWIWRLLEGESFVTARAIDTGELGLFTHQPGRVAGCVRMRVLLSHDG